ncbi:MAG: cell division protein FtsL [Eubacterium sp.]|nr:cell division protein FtsL [Eubacterium sp.]
MERRNHRRDEYIMGNTARQIEPAIQDRPQIRNNRVSERKKAKSALAINGVSVFIMAIIAVCCIATIVAYLYLHSAVSETRNNISKIKTDINTVQSQNDALKYSINTYVDSEHVYKVATKKLGMRQAKGDQLSIYKSSDKGYTVQYGDIPNK